MAPYADTCNVRASPEIPRQLELLRRRCDQEGRDYTAIEKTAPFGFDVGPDGSRVDEVVEQLRCLASIVLGLAVGVDGITAPPGRGAGGDPGRGGVARPWCDSGVVCSPSPGPTGSFAWSVLARSMYYEEYGARSPLDLDPQS